MASETLRNWLQEAKTKAFPSVVRSLLKSCIKKLVRTRIKFSESEISKLLAGISHKHAVRMHSHPAVYCCWTVWTHQNSSSLLPNHCRVKETCCCTLGLEVIGNGLLCSVLQQFCKVTFQTRSVKF